ncbi:MAG: hypothetical protein IPP83_13300 [Flavobacteriales bacterium]|nr:hypothetical protein [Flavobacteriales bacterium]
MNAPQLPLNTAISVSKLDPHVVAVIVPHTPLTFHHTFMYGPSHMVAV